MKFNEHYNFEAFYTREEDLTYSNRNRMEEKGWVLLFFAFFFCIIAFLIGLGIYLYFWKSLILPVFLIGFGALFFAVIGAAVGFRFLDVLNHEVDIELNEIGFIQTIKKRKTQETMELHLPYETIESVTLGRFLYVVSPRRYSIGTYWISMELAIKGVTPDGQMVLKRLPLKNPDEIQLWINQFQRNNIPIYYMDTLIKDLTLNDYDKINKVKYPEETGEIPLAYKTVGKPAPVNWDGKKIHN